MSKIVKLVERKPLNSTATVELLEDMFSQAKAGKIEEILIIAFNDEGDFFSRGTKTKSICQQVGALVFLIADLIRNNPPDGQ